jgi:hypothetical protein
MPDSFASFVNNPSAPSVRFVPVVKAEVDLPGGTCKALLVGAAGTANLIDAEGGVRAGLPLQQGYNPLRCAALRCAALRCVRVATGGTATDIWALY